MSSAGLCDGEVLLVSAGHSKGSVVPSLSAAVVVCVSYKHLVCVLVVRIIGGFLNQGVVAIGTRPGGEGFVVSGLFSMTFRTVGTSVPSSKAGGSFMSLTVTATVHWVWEAPDGSVAFTTQDVDVVIRSSICRRRAVQWCH